MKRRSHRLPMTEPRHDDWVDGSWTVDCICGVTDDDGEEMVDCDECGVWVHTRCSRYVKSEKSFACDKCKSKNSGGGAAAAGGGGGSGRNDSEETEVAEFLLELPTKTLRMENPNPNPATVSSHRPFRLWTNIPMEERVHVQGVPGGEPALFSGIGMSSIFGPQLWKCSGYVPKKFNFRHSELPFLGNGEVEEKEEGKMDKTIGEENSTRADNDAGVLITLLKKNANPLPTPEVDSVGVNRPVEGGTSCEVVTPREKKKADVEIPNYKTPEEGKKKESSSVPVLLHPGKRRKEGNGMKDQPVKKKVRTIEKEGDVRKRALHSSKAASTFSSDGKHVEFSQDRGAKAANNGIGDRLLDGLGECATNLASNEHATLRNDVSSDEISRGGNIGDKVLVGSDNVSKTSNSLEALEEVSGSKSTPINEEAAKDGLERCTGEDGTVEYGVRERKPVAVDVRIAGEDAKQSEHCQDSDIDEANSRPNKKLKGELKADHCVESSHPIDVKLDSNKATSQHPESTVNVDFEENKVESTVNVDFEENKVVEKSPISSEASEPKELKHSSEGSLGPRKRSSGLEHTSEVADELHKSNKTARSNSTASYQRKSAVSGLKSSSSSGCIGSKSPGTLMAATVQSPPIHSRLKESSEGSSVVVKDNTSTHKVEPDDKCGKLKKLVKEPSRSRSLPKASESNRFSNTSDSKRPSFDSKDSSVHSSGKATLVPNVASNRSLGECESVSTMEGSPNVENKVVPGKGEKVHQSGGPHTSSKGNVTSNAAPTSSSIPATLSDEELALLLHQELNSSPRVPRVPRMRNAGSLPHTTGPSATTMLMKRSSSGGGKDLGVASRRRTKEFSVERSHEVDNDAKKTETKPYSPDNRRQDSGYTVDLHSRKEVDGKNVKSTKKTNAGSSFSSSNEANGHNVLTSHHPTSRNASDDDPRAVGRQMNRTLPEHGSPSSLVKEICEGLIAEIMSEGKRMTYEELCNAVLPHWPHLRKHNGERYAYSSHSQAVLDCLRNRSEWARLVDRGPKTNAGRKRRKLDPDSISIESEDNEDERVKNGKDKSFYSHQEDFPKGKRKARRRRRLALQGRGVVRRRRADVISDDESEPFSNSSEDSTSTEEEEEIQGGGPSLEGSGASSSSDDEVR